MMFSGMGAMDASARLSARTRGESLTVGVPEPSCSDR